ncbi:MAG: MFS transporter [Erythrobacter sp.]|uniref:spinster family MFS transporter n=1 Tax=Erythrobacter sp. TaxID=1042 RepID=UPI0032EC9425
MASTPDPTTESPLTGAPVRGEGSGYRWYVLFLLICTLLFSVADRLVFSILLEDIKAEFDFSDAQLGLLGGVAFTLTYVVAGFPAARLADRSVRKNIVAGAISFWSAMTALCGAATGFWTLFFARTGVGVGEGCSGPASQSMLADYFPRRELARAMGFLTLGSTLGTAFGLIAGGLLAEEFGWRWAFVLMAAPGFAIGGLLYFTVIEPRRGRYAPVGMSTDQTPLGETLRSLLANRVFLGLALGWAVQIMIGYALAFWMAPAMIRLFEVSVGDVALYLGLAFLIGGVPGPVLGGVLTDWLTRFDERWRAWFPGIVSLGCILPLWLAFRSGDFAVFLGLFAIGYAIFVASQAPIMSGIQSAVEPSQRGFAVAVALFFNNLFGQAAGLYLIGWLSDTLEPTQGNAALAVSVLSVSFAAGIGALAIFVWTGREMTRSGYVERIKAEG